MSSLSHIYKFYVAGECFPEHNIVESSSNIGDWILWCKQRNYDNGRFGIVVIQISALEPFLTGL
jgi:hypothetical protein